MEQKRGQAATEYLIILAVVVIIALIVVAILGGFPGIGRGASSKASSAYWNTASPVGITSYDLSDTAASNSVILINNAPTTINVSSITFDGTSSALTPVSILAGQTKTVAFGGGGYTCTSGETYELDVIVTYDNPDTGETGLKFTGDIELVGECLDI